MKKNTHRRTNRKKIAIVITISLILLITSLVVNELIWQKAATVNSGILMADRIFSQHTKELWTVSFNPDGSLVASADVDGAIKIWRKEDGTVVHNLKQITGITSLAFSPDGRYLVTAGYDEKIRFWDLTTGKVAKEFVGNIGTV